MFAFKDWLCGALCGAGTMYYFDPELGRRRRALLRDQIDRMAHRVPEAFDAAWRDLTNRSYGAVAELGSCLAAHVDSDEVVKQRVRTKSGRFVTHPASLEVDVADGGVTLRGPILAGEVQPLIQALRFVRGVRSIDNQLEVHMSAGNVSGLQGMGQLPGEPAELLQANWTPGVRLVCGAAGATLVANGLLNRSAAATLLALAGFGLLARSLSSPAQQPRTFSAGQRPIRANPAPSAAAGQPARNLGPGVPDHEPGWLQKPAPGSGLEATIPPRPVL